MQKPFVFLSRARYLVCEAVGALVEGVDGEVGGGPSRAQLLARLHAYPGQWTWRKIESVFGKWNNVILMFMLLWLLVRKVRKSV